MSELYRRPSEGEGHILKKAIPALPIGTALRQPFMVPGHLQEDPVDDFQRVYKATIAQSVS
jgi:hypothetical protein